VAVRVLRGAILRLKSRNNMAEETVVIDKMNRESGGKLYAVDEDVRVYIDQANARIIIYDADGNARVLIGFDEDGF